MNWYKQYKQANKDATYSYSCVMAMLNDEDAKEVHEWGKEIVSDDCLYTDPDDPSLGRENEMHTTVLYGLHTNECCDVIDVVEEVKPFKLKVKGISKFDTNDDYDVIKLDVDAPELRKMNKALSELPNSNKYPEYKPHLTIAYVKPDSVDVNAIENKFKDKEFQINILEFSPAEGNRENIELKGE